MPRLSYSQMEGYWIHAGGPPAVAPIAAAIGEAESGGNTDALNPNDNGGRQSSYGVWQISNGTHTPPDPRWADPAVNARLAVGKYQGAGNNFSPWGTYDSGAYKAYLNGSTTPDLNVQGNPNATAVETAAHNQADCWFGFNGIPGSSIINDIPGVGSGGNVGQMCILSRSQARGVAGAFLLVFGTVGFSLAMGLGIALAGRNNPIGQRANAMMGRSNDAAEADLDAADAQQAAQAKAAQRQASAPQGRHAKSGPNAPAAGRHARP